MNDDIDPLELELAALTPLEISPRLKHDIAERLAEVDRRSSRSLARHRRWWLAVAGSGFIAASLAAVVFHRLGNPPGPVRIGPPQPTRAQTFGATADALISYERALAKSADEFESLLSQNARAAPSNPGIAALSVLSLSDPKVTALIGEE
jgi:hypothetical protein